MDAFKAVHNEAKNASLRLLADLKNGRVFGQGGVCNASLNVCLEMGVGG